MIGEEEKSLILTFYYYSVLLNNPKSIGWVLYRCQPTIRLFDYDSWLYVTRNFPLSSKYSMMWLMALGWLYCGIAYHSHMILSGVVSLWQDIRWVHIALVLECSYVLLVHLQLKMDVWLEEIIHLPCPTQNQGMGKWWDVMRKCWLTINHCG